MVTGTFLYYARAVNRIMLTILSGFMTKQANPTPTTMQKTKQFLYYAASNSNATLTYNASNMVLVVHSDASYLNEKSTKQSMGTIFFLTNTDIFLPNNGVVLNTAQIIKAVMSSIVETELGALYINAKQATPMHQTILELGHLQSLMPIQTDKSTVFGMVTNKIIPKVTTAIDMFYHWLHHHEQQQQF